MRNNFLPQGDWAWTTGGNVFDGYENFNSGEPGGPTGNDCLAMWGYGIWYDFECDDKNEYVCQTAAFVSS